jgi:hypothetical protein
MSWNGGDVLAVYVRAGVAALEKRELPVRVGPPNGLRVYLVKSRLPNSATDAE